MGEVLFEITKDKLETGMRGYPVGYCVTSSVDPQKGLFYVGRPVTDLVRRSPEEVIYLLLHGKEGSSSDIESFKKDLFKRATLSKKTIESIRKLPAEAHPMNLLSCSLLLAGTFEKAGDFQQDCLNVIAKMPALVATLINHHAGWGETKAFNPALGYMENFTAMLNVPEAEEENLLEAFRLFNILHYDHGGGNLSAFVGKAVASGLEDMYGCLSAAMCALAGPRHGRANQDCLEFVNAAVKDLGEDASQSDVENFLQKKLDKNELIYGFGHAVLRVEDPRAGIFYSIAEKKYADHPLVKMTMKLRKAGPQVLGKNPKINNPFPNVDAISGTFLTAAGFRYPEYYTVLFGLSRVVGIAIQIVYERCVARDGKGVPIVRPKYLYKELS